MALLPILIYGLVRGISLAVYFSSGRHRLYSLYLSPGRKVLLIPCIPFILCQCISSCLTLFVCSLFEYVELLSDTVIKALLRLYYALLWLY